MKLALLTAVCGRNEITRKHFLETTLANCAEPPEVIVVSNGSTSEEVLELAGMLERAKREFKVARAQLHILDEPCGSAAAFNAGAALVRAEKVACLHNDLGVFVPGWDQQVIGFLDQNHGAGLVGFAGAKAMYAHGRADVVSSLDDWKIHGGYCGRPEPVAVLDGLAMIARISDYRTWGGMEERYVHHFYDIDLSLRSHFSGKRNYVLPILCHHFSGQTSVASPAYVKWAERLGGDTQIHARATQLFREFWAYRLPVTVA